MNAQAVSGMLLELRRLARRTVERRSFDTLQRLVQRLERATPERVPAVMAEALVARRALAAGCAIEAETPTPTGRTCDFRLTRGAELLHVHVKRLDAPPFDPPLIPAALRRALRDGRPARVELRWDPQLNALGLRRLGHAFEAFLRDGEVGESICVRDAAQRELGALRIDRPAETLDVHVERPGREAVLARLDRLLERAAQQCMPGQANAILVVGTSACDADLLDQALLGSFIARWDRLPRRGERQAYGRDDTGLWSRGLAKDAGIACWCTLRERRAMPVLSGGHLWLRDRPAPSPASAALARASLLRSRAGLDRVLASAATRAAAARRTIGGHRNAAAILREAVGVLQPEVEEQQSLLPLGADDRILRDHAALELHFHGEVVAREQVGGQRKNARELARGETMVVIVGHPHLQRAVRHRATRAAAVDEALLRAPDLGHMEVRGHERPVRQREAQLARGRLAQQAVEFGQAHRVRRHAVSFRAVTHHSPTTRSCGGRPRSGRVAGGSHAVRTKSFAGMPSISKRAPRESSWSTWRRPISTVSVTLESR